MELSWTNKFIKYLLFLFNFLFVISGIILIAVGVSVKTYFTKYDLFLSSNYISLPNLLIATGSIIFFISFFGCCGAWKESYSMIYVFSFLLCLIFILEFSAGIAGYVLRNKTSGYLKTELTFAQQKYVVNDTDHENVRYMWDLIQYEFSCCGVESAQDWSTVFKGDQYENGTLPASCCKSVTGAVGKTDCNLYHNETAIYYKIGCVDGFGKYLREHAVTLGGCGIAIGFIQLFGIIFAFHLAKRIRSGFYST